MYNLPIEIIDKIYNYYWNHIYFINVVNELNLIINTSKKLFDFTYNIFLINDDFNLTMNNDNIRQIIIFNEFLKKYSINKNSIGQKIIKYRNYPNHIKLLSNMYCRDLIYFSSYCLHHSGYMRYYTQNKLDKINDKVLYYKC